MHSFYIFLLVITAGLSLDCCIYTDIDTSTCSDRCGSLCVYRLHECPYIVNCSLQSRYSLWLCEENDKCTCKWYNYAQIQKESNSTGITITIPLPILPITITLG